MIIIQSSIFTLECLTNDETYVESLNSLNELYEHLNEDDYNISLWLVTLKNISTSRNI